MRRIGKACMGLLLALLALLSCLPGMARAQFDPAHAVWDGLLRKHVVPVDGGHATRVNYRGMAADRKALQAYLGELSRVSADDYARWTRDRKLAFLINAYNAFTVEKVLMRYPDLKSIRDFGIIFGNPWKDDFFTLLGLPQNLDGLEHGLIRAPGVFDDPRIHFAVNCAAVGCPALRGRPMWPRGWMRNWMRRPCASWPTAAATAMPAMRWRSHGYLTGMEETSPPGIAASIRWRNTSRAMPMYWQTGKQTGRRCAVRNCQYGFWTMTGG